jgi:cytochrome c-type biogenesis protein CcmH/NrfG
MRTINLQRQWTSEQALILVTICLALGIGGGWLIRGLASFTTAGTRDGASSGVPVASAKSVSPAPTPASIREMADSQAAPLLATLQANPRDAGRLTSIGNLYYDAQQYATAVGYYNRALQANPSDASVRTDMATAFWYLGNTTEAISQFNKALAYAPTNPNTLFNLGLVKWQGQHDSAGAIALWKKLLESNPGYEEKDKVLKMLSDVESQTTANAAPRGH